MQLMRYFIKMSCIYSVLTAADHIACVYFMCHVDKRGTVK